MTSTLDVTIVDEETHMFARRSNTAAFDLALILCALITSPALGQTSQRELVLLNWSEYMDPELVGKFEQLHDIKVRERYFETDDLRDEMLLETDGAGADLAIVNGTMIESYRKRGWLADATVRQIPNLKHVDDKWLNAFEGVNGHAVPYFWGTLGIGYRTDLVATPPQTWMDLYKPAEELREKIAMVDSQRDIMGMALKALGYSANSSDSQQIRESMELVLTQQPYVKTYTYMVLDENSAIVKGDIVMAMMFSGDALMVKEYNDNIEYIVPKEGGNLWVDYLVVMQSSNKKDIAYAFIDFLNEPEHAAQLAEYVYYATPNNGAEKLMPAEFREDPVIYPSKEVLSRCETYKKLPPRAVKKRNNNFARLKH